MQKAFAGLMISLAGHGSAGEFLFPVECTLGETCFIQHYVDRDPTEAVQDFGCGSLSYEGHTGTDFALPSEAAMWAGVNVRAVASGMVKGVRDGVPDLGTAGTPVARASGIECGNGLLLAHDDGMESQYCHLREGSLRFAVGDKVDAGAVLGQIGQSGAADFPHLHLTIRDGDTVIDPYQPDQNGCRSGMGQLWSDPLPYTPTGFATLGFSTGIPDYDALKRGDLPAAPQRGAGAFVIWVMGFGSQPGDSLTLEISGPTGVIISEEITLDRSQARYMRAVGRRTPRQGWDAGTYLGTATVFRDRVPIDQQEIETILD